MALRSLKLWRIRSYEKQSANVENLQRNWMRAMKSLVTSLVILPWVQVSFQRLPRSQHLFQHWFRQVIQSDQLFFPVYFQELLHQKFQLWRVELFLWHPTSYRQQVNNCVLFLIFMSVDDVECSYFRHTQTSSKELQNNRIFPFSFKSLSCFKFSFSSHPNTKILTQNFSRIFFCSDLLQRWSYEYKRRLSLQWSRQVKIWRMHAKLLSPEVEKAFTGSGKSLHRKWRKASEKCSILLCLF